MISKFVAGTCFDLHFAAGQASEKWSKDQPQLCCHQVPTGHDSGGEDHSVWDPDRCGNNRMWPPGGWQYAERW